MDTIITNDDFDISQDDYLNKPYFDKEENLNAPDISSEDNIIFINTEEDD